MLVRRLAEADPELEPTFVDVNYDAGKFSRLPGSGTLAGVREIRRGLGDVHRFDAILWATWAAKFVPDLVEVRPAFLSMDMTPTQMTEMGEHYGYSSERAEFFAGWKRRATERIYRAAAHFFPWNAWVGQSLMADWGVPAEKITPVSPGVDVGAFAPKAITPGPNNGEKFPRYRGGGGNSVRLLFVGGDFMRKGGDSLLRWARETTFPIEVHVVTRDKVSDAPPNVRYHRGVAPLSPELVALYQSADIFVLPTRADCYSLVALEAMACGLPVVISPLGGIPELVEDGENGYLVAPDDDETLKARLDTLVADPELRARMGAEGRRRAVSRFDARCGVMQVLEALKNPPLSGARG
jgi:glycosyltransferase involved in cell wall biosynthesis